jgi:predicted nucleic acid-binding protein
MSANKATYLDSSALVKLAVREPESAALRRYLRRRRPLIVSALARTEVARALLSLGPEAVRRGQDVMAASDRFRSKRQECPRDLGPGEGAADERSSAPEVAA